ncbi:methyltransferase domain-containing protein [Mycetocola zhadangensis]|uniref:Methyltransferase domain-containing protein n=1 Tax=Mycetocola zhadangensis TaxID=1164595 RepID=A0A3L7J7D6_9MICO|nr:methyltransferase domain-containing protein [Mycetocola zhadangensis]RLQ86265.1 methyltransferase domain-containing protein [Mycetocola zhadangensis]GGE89723.1 SAM-dependent methyltransferase [Mycetocola zhadangensis]
MSPVGTLVVGCDAGHRFDVNKRGYISLLPPASRMTGDSQAMLDARAHFFDTGNFDSIADAVAASSVQALASGSIGPHGAEAADTAGSRPIRLAEIGCGTGYYLDRATRGLSQAGAVVEPVAADLSPFAVRMAVRAVPGAAGVVLDVWQPLPFVDAHLDGIISVFAPRNLPEFARILRPGGCLVAVVPTTRHLHQVRAEGLAIGIPDGKPDALTDAASPWFAEVDRSLVEFDMKLTQPELNNLIGMGPSAHHSAAATNTGPVQQGDVPGAHAAGEGRLAAGDATPANGEDAAAAGEGSVAGSVRLVTASVTVLTYRLTRSH